MGSLPVFVIASNSTQRSRVCTLLKDLGVTARGYADLDDAGQIPNDACLLFGVDWDELARPEPQESFRSVATRHHVITLLRAGDLAGAVQAMECGALSVIETPYTAEKIAAALDKAAQLPPRGRDLARRRLADQRLLNQLTEREREVLNAIARGQATKQIAFKLNVSARTIDKHREHILRKTGATWPRLIALVERLRLLEAPPPGRLDQPFPRAAPPRPAHSPQ